jgi:hypothetical protein
MYLMTSLYTTLAQNGAVGRSLLDCDECKKPLYMSVCALTRISDGPKTTGFVSAEHPEQEWDELNVKYYDSNGETKRGVPESFICPISYAVMVDPVVAPDNQTYDFSSLQDYANRAPATGMISPTTRELMDPTLKVYNNIALRGMIYEFVQKHGGELQTKPVEPIIPGFLYMWDDVQWYGPGTEGPDTEFWTQIRQGEISHYAVSDIEMGGTFYWACNIVQHNERCGKVFLKGFGPRPYSLDFSLKFASRDSFISSMEWSETLLYITVDSTDLQDGGLWVYTTSGTRKARGNGRKRITSSALVQHDNGTLKYILQHQDINTSIHSYPQSFQIYALDEYVAASTFDYDIRAVSLIREDIREIGVVGNDIVALLKSGAVMKYTQSEDVNGRFDTNLGTELVPQRPSVWRPTYIVTGCGMFAVFTVDYTKNLSAIVYDSTGKKLVKGNIPCEPYLPKWMDFNVEGRGIIPKSGEDGTFSIFFMASNRLNEVQFVI